MRRGSLTRNSLIAGVLIELIGSAAMLAATPQAGTLSIPSPKPKSYVTYVAEEQNVEAGKQSVLELRFHVADGFHVNSHTPKSELLIPTRLQLQPAAGVKAEAAVYPAGITYAFSFDPTNKLDVYTGDFTIRLPVLAQTGQHTVDGSLRYQACDHAACYPPRSLPVEIIFTAK
jgi:hypothetical protein